MERQFPQRAETVGRNLISQPAIDRQAFFKPSLRCRIVALPKRQSSQCYEIVANTDLIA